MRCCLLNLSLETGGAERQMADLARHWSAAHHLSILSLSKEGGEGLGLSHATTLSARMPRHPVRRLFWALVMIARLRRALKQDRVEVLVTFLWLPTLLAAISLLGLRSRPRLIWSVQCDVIKEFEMHRDGRLRLLLVRLVCSRRVDRFVAVSKGVEASLRELFPGLAGKLSLVPNSVDLERVRRAADSTMRLRRLGQATLRVIVVGRLHHAKGADVFLRAVSLLVNHRISLECFILGEGAERERLHLLAASLGLSEHVRFEGFQLNPYQWLTAADIFVSPSRWETFGIAILEAMALGVPVIATATDGAREILTDGEDGLLVPVESPEALAHAIASLAADPVFRGALASRARRTARSFDARLIAQRYQQLVDGIERPRS